MLGDLLSAGRGTEADPDAAREWYEKASAQGLQAASVRLMSITAPTSGAG